MKQFSMKQTNMETQFLFSGIQFHIWSVCLRKLKELQFQCVAIPFILHWYSLLYLEVCQCGKAWSPPMRHITPTRSSFWPEPALYSISHLGKIISEGAINHFYASKMYYTLQIFVWIYRIISLKIYDFPTICKNCRVSL